MRYSLILLLIALVLSYVLSFYLNPVRLAMRSSDPAGGLNRLIAEDQDLGFALTRADSDGDVTPLTQWLARAEPEARQRLAGLFMKQLIDASPSSEYGAGWIDDRAAYRYRHRFRAFANLGTGEPALDSDLDNMLANALVAGSEQPTPADLALARTLLPRVQQTQTVHPDDSLADIIGSVQFMLGDYAAASASYAHALKLATAKTKPAPTAKPILDLYQRRLDAAKANAEAVKAGSTEHVPLPLSFARTPTNEVERATTAPAPAAGISSSPGPALAAPLSPSPAPAPAAAEPIAPETPLP